jgi:hypothetical protein
MRKWGARICIFLLYVVALTTWAAIFLVCGLVTLLTAMETPRTLWREFRFEAAEITLIFLDSWAGEPADDGAESGA